MMHVLVTYGIDDEIIVVSRQIEAEQDDAEEYGEVVGYVEIPVLAGE